MNKSTQILFIVIITALFANFGFAQQEKVYTRTEVDTKAIIKKFPVPKQFKIGIVLRKVRLHYK